MIFVARTMIVLVRLTLIMFVTLILVVLVALLVHGLLVAGLVLGMLSFRYPVRVMMLDPIAIVAIPPV